MGPPSGAAASELIELYRPLCPISHCLSVMDKHFFNEPIQILRYVTDVGFEYINYEGGHNP
jgi:hypothetical protein